MSESSTSPGPNDQNHNDEKTPGIRKETRWEEVATTAGITAAHILAGRLQAEGIPARAWQEGAGQATGLIVGLLGTGHVVVPEEYAEKARRDFGDDDNFADDNYEE